ncbi:hypothetical protein PMAN_a3088 [Pseudoalteromonas marina]|nr:hypothetical protein PMAN_a3088 [Pseudoalteromonas marina]
MRENGLNTCYFFSLPLRIGLLKFLSVSGFNKHWQVAKHKNRPMAVLCIN